MSSGQEETVGRRVLDRWILVATVGEHGNEAVVSKYVREQGQEKEYKKLYRTVLEPKQMSIWDL